MESNSPLRDVAERGARKLPGTRRVVGLYRREGSVWRSGRHTSRIVPVDSLAARFCTWCVASTSSSSLRRGATSSVWVRPTAWMSCCSKYSEANGPSLTLRRGLRRIAGALHQMWRLDHHLAPPRRHSPLRLPETSRALHHSHRDLPNRGIWFHRPGDLQHTRWMSKLVYV